MSQLTMISIPGFFDLADSAVAAGQVASDDVFLKLSHNAKFAALRPEIIYMGFYANGDTVPVPTSPVDGYVYSRAECMFIALLYSTRAPASGFTPGQQLRPAIASANGGAGDLYTIYHIDVDDTTGLVSTSISYDVQGGAETPTTDGIVKVYCAAIRSSINASN